MSTEITPPPCHYVGDYLTGLERRKLALLHGRNWRRCTHPDAPRGPNVREGVECVPTCPGYRAGNECPPTGPQSLKWAYGVTTIPERRDDLLPRTLLSLREAGFPAPRLFVDGGTDSESWRDEFGLEVTCRYPKTRTHGNWLLGAHELFIREPDADRYVMFQDDLTASKGLRDYLERCHYPENGYWNLYTFPRNQKLCPDGYTGWYRSNQKGLGAVGLVFDRKCLLALLSSEHMTERPLDPKRGWRAIDGGIVTALAKKGYVEFVHSPSLVQHTGDRSSMGNRPHERAPSFTGGVPAG